MKDVRPDAARPGRSGRPAVLPPLAANLGKRLTFSMRLAKPLKDLFSNDHIIKYL